MLDPGPSPPTWLQSAVLPLADAVSFHTLPYHIHELLVAAVFYQLIQISSPAISSALFPNTYPNLPARTRLNWDVHVVSLVQSTIINAFALWVIFTDEERKSMTAIERVYGYTGACGLVQGLAAGYFLWDLFVCTRHVRIFGIGLWAHAVAALVVFSFGFVCASLHLLA